MVGRPCGRGAGGPGNGGAVGSRQWGNGDRPGRGRAGARSGRGRQSSRFRARRCPVGRGRTQVILPALRTRAAPQTNSARGAEAGNVHSSSRRGRRCPGRQSGSAGGVGGSRTLRFRILASALLPRWRASPALVRVGQARSSASRSTAWHWCPELDWRRAADRDGIVRDGRRRRGAAVVELTGYHDKSSGGGRRGGSGLRRR